jgi:hypothetical protein
MDKILTVLRILHTNVRIKVSDVAVNKFIYVGSEINSKEINGKINKRIQNSCKFCLIVKGILWKIEIAKQHRVRIYKAYF